MLIVDDTTLIHVDSSSDIIEHYGVKGMKWGKRIGKTWAGQYVKNYANAVRHPIRQARASAALVSKSGMPVIGTKRQLKFLNNHVAAQNSARKQLSVDKTASKNAFKENKKRLKDDMKKRRNAALSKIGKSDEAFSQGKIDRKTYRQDEKNYSKERKAMKKDYKNQIKALKKERRNSISVARSKYRNVGNNVVY